jgi:hypothetical protein
MKSARLWPVLAAAALLGCDGSRQGMGTVTSVIVLATDSLWAEVGDSVEAALAPRIFTVRDEPTFDVTQVSPLDPTWRELRRFRQILAIGTREDGWVEPVLSRADDRGAAPGIVQARNVWARNQQVTAMVLPAGAGAEAALAQVPAASAAIDSAFRRYAVERMFTSRPDTVLRDSLRRDVGFGLLLPNVYRQLTRDPHVLLFQASTQLGGDLVRSVLVTYTDGLVEPTPAAALAWRDSVAATEYRPAQVTGAERIEGQRLTLAGAPAAEVQGIWDGTDPTWPMSGPFISRMVQCPAQNRTYLLDGWLYSPGRAKYEFMIQLQTILDTFTCG